MKQVSQHVFSLSNSKISADDLAGVVLDTACTHGEAYLWRIDETIRVFNTNDDCSHEGKTLAALMKKKRAEFLGVYNALARGPDILGDIMFVIDALRKSKFTVPDQSFAML